MNRATMAALAVVMAAGGVLAQPVQWPVEDGGNGHWYEVVVGFGPCWQQQRVWAEQRGGYLATVGSSAEQAFLEQAIVGREFIAIGGFQPAGSPEPNGGWSWVTGEPWGTSVRWAAGQPENFRGTQNYLILTTAGCHDGDDCPPYSAQGYLIEYSADCNNDGIVDKGQILSGQLPDANNNGIPDGVAIITQPTDQNVGVDTPVAFVVEVGADATCTVPVTYQWQRRNPLVADAASPNAWIDLADGNGIFGTRAPNLTLLRPIPGLATGYRCKIGGGCGCEPGQGGFVYTNTVNFSVACPADFNADGGIDFGDVEAFFERWENGC